MRVQGGSHLDLSAGSSTVLLVNDSLARCVFLQRIIVITYLGKPANVDHLGRIHLLNRGNRLLSLQLALLAFVFYRPKWFKLHFHLKCVCVCTTNHRLSPSQRLAEVKRRLHLYFIWIHRPSQRRLIRILDELL